MKILFHEDFLDHNVGSDIEGPYRLKGFKGFKSQDPIDGEPFLELVHTKEYIDYVKKGCQQETYLAEVQVTPATYRAACKAVGMTIQPGWPR